MARLNRRKHEDCAICGQNVNEIIKSGIVVKKLKRPNDLKGSGHRIHVRAAQDLLIKGYDLAAIMRAGGWSDTNTISR